MTITRRPLRPQRAVPAPRRGCLDCPGCTGACLEAIALWFLPEVILRRPGPPR
jgi:heterodisulfide reductase subunit C